MHLDENGSAAAIDGAIRERAEHVAETLRQSMSGMLQEHRALRTGFEERLYQRWGRGLDLFEAVVIAAQEAGDMFHQEHRDNIPAEGRLVYAVLVKSHARACLTAWEVQSLLRCGYAAAALARWRTLHEIAVVAFLVQHHGRDLAERYLLHDIIDSCRAAQLYQQHHQRLGESALDPAVIQRLEQQRRELLARFGKEFDSTYGWAADISRCARPTFAHLEKMINLDHARPYYKWASHRVHAEAQGIRLLKTVSGPIMLAGPSNGHLADPARLTLISLLQCTVALLTFVPDAINLVTCRALDLLADEAIREFLIAHHELMNEEFERSAEHIVTR